MGCALIMGAVDASGFEMDQVSQQIGFFLCAAFAAEHVLAMTFEPFVGLGRGTGFGRSVGELLGRGLQVTPILPAAVTQAAD